MWLKQAEKKLLHEWWTLGLDITLVRKGYSIVLLSRQWLDTQAREWRDQDKRGIFVYDEEGNQAAYLGDVSSPEEAVKVLKKFKFKKEA